MYVHLLLSYRWTTKLNLTQKFSPPEDEQEEWLDTAYDDTDIIVLHRFFDKYADKVGKELLSTAKSLWSNSSTL